MYRTVRIVALLALIVTAALNIAYMFTMAKPDTPIGDIISRAATPTAFWCALVWLVWTRSRNWSLGIGCFLLFVLAFQIYLWTLAMARPDRDRMGFGSTPLGFFISEIPLAVAAVSCIWMRWVLPKLPHAPEQGS